MSASFSYLSNANPEYIDQLYKSYLADPSSVPADWKSFFDGFQFAQANFDKKTQNASVSPSTEGLGGKEFNVINLINGYRQRGHLFAKTNPVRENKSYSPTLAVENFGLSQTDLDTVFQAGAEVGLGAAPLKDIIAVLEQTYCRSIGAEYMYIREPEMLAWVRERMEKERNTPVFGVKKKERILRKLNQGVLFEDFLAKKFVGKKRFSLEGAEALIPALDAVIEKGASMGIEEFVLGMAHRGRLNVLANIMQKGYDDIFDEFAGKENEQKVVIEGVEYTVWNSDVKYHMGYSHDFVSESGNQVHLSLLPNPSHLETVAPVVQGVSRAKIDRKYKDANKLAPIIIHGDAAVAGQGIVYEVIQMSLLNGYKTGGTIHLVINNQVGFTTNESDARSSTYCTDIAKVTLSPVFHVNGDDVESLVYAIEMAMEFRQKFNRDVFIEILCYRKYGHNEGDEPTFTQPLLYGSIKKHLNPAKTYVEKLKSSGDLAVAEMATEMEKEFKQLLQSELEETMRHLYKSEAPYLQGVWTGIRPVNKETDFVGAIVPTGVAAEKLVELAKKMHDIPANVNIHPKLRKIFDDRLKGLEANKLDWAMGELLAYATLLTEGFPIRLSGQDVERGTFAHRHCVVIDQENEAKYVPLNNLQENQAKFQVYNSLLSEYGVLGFEYGYSIGHPNQLVVWEAQFGDFANGAQIIMDQYISSAETKWQRMSGLMQLLPHGYEGQGPEHSSARIERYMELCAGKNMQVCNITTPANLFHAIRRQLHREFRIPLVIFSPKKLLRYPTCVSKIEDFTEGGFQELIGDDYANAKKVKTVLFCSGKIYYDLFEYQQANGRDDVAIVRLEQLYPLPSTQLRATAAKYAKKTKYFWVQEEPRNMGAWAYIKRMFNEIEIDVIARKPNPAPATGLEQQHNKQQEYLVKKAFGVL